MYLIYIWIFDLSSNLLKWNYKTISIFLLGLTWFQPESLCQPPLAIFLFYFPNTQPIWHPAHLSLLAHPLLSSSGPIKSTVSTTSLHRFHSSPKLHLFLLYLHHNRAPTCRHFGSSSPAHLWCSATSCYPRWGPPPPPLYSRALAARSSTA
jgi:hypothetical protein